MWQAAVRPVQGRRRLTLTAQGGGRYATSPWALDMVRLRRTTATTNSPNSLNHQTSSRGSGARTDPARVRARLAAAVSDPPPPPHRPAQNSVVLELRNSRAVEDGATPEPAELVHPPDKLHRSGFRWSDRLGRVVIVGRRIGDGRRRRVSRRSCFVGGCAWAVGPG